MHLHNVREKVLDKGLCIPRIRDTCQRASQNDVQLLSKVVVATSHTAPPSQAPVSYTHLTLPTTPYV